MMRATTPLPDGRTVEAVWESGRFWATDEGLQRDVLTTSTVALAPPSPGVRFDVGEPAHVIAAWHAAVWETYRVASTVWSGADVPSDPGPEHPGRIY